MRPRNVLRGIMRGAKTSLLPIQQTLTSCSYVDLVLDPIVRLWRRAAGDDFNYMNDNAPPHTSRVSK